MTLPSPKRPSISHIRNRALRGHIIKMLQNSTLISTQFYAETPRLFHLLKFALIFQIENGSSKVNGRKNKKGRNGAVKVNVFPEKNIVYMWCDINVFTSKTSEDRRRNSKVHSLLRKINCCSSNTESIKRKHILQNGNEIINRLLTTIH